MDGPVSVTDLLLFKNLSNPKRVNQPLFDRDLKQGSIANNALPTRAMPTPTRTPMRPRPRTPVEHVSPVRMPSPHVSPHSSPVRTPAKTPHTPAPPYIPSTPAPQVYMPPSYSEEDEATEKRAVLRDLGRLQHDDQVVLSKAYSMNDSLVSMKTELLMQEEFIETNTYVDYGFMGVVVVFVLVEIANAYFGPFLKLDNVSKNIADCYPRLKRPLRKIYLRYFRAGPSSPIMELVIVIGTTFFMTWVKNMFPEGGLNPMAILSSLMGVINNGSGGQGGSPFAGFLGKLGGMGVFGGGNAPRPPPPAAAPPRAEPPPRQSAFVPGPSAYDFPPQEPPAEPAATGPNANAPATVRRRMRGPRVVS